MVVNVVYDISTDPQNQGKHKIFNFATNNSKIQKAYQIFDICF